MRTPMVVWNVILLLALVCLTGCPTDRQNSVVGAWEIRLDECPDEPAEDISKIVLLLFRDGTAAVYQEQDIYGGDWSVMDGKFLAQVNVTGRVASYELEASLAGIKLIEGTYAHSDDRFFSSGCFAGELIEF